VSEQHQPICVESILVSLDTSRHSFSALKAAVELAHHYDAKLTGLFIQDSALLSLAETQFLYEVGEYTAVSRKITVDGLTHGMIAQSRWITRTFKNLTAQAGVEGEFLVFHGNIDEVIERESEKCDLLVIGKSGTYPMQRSRLGSTAKVLIQQGKKSILIVEEDSNLGYPIFVLFEESPLGWTSLETARELLGPGEKINLLLEEADSEGFARDKEGIRAWAKEKKVNFTFQPFKREGFGRVIQKIKTQRTGLFILPFMLKPLHKTMIEKYLKDISLPILLVRKSE